MPHFIYAEKRVGSQHRGHSMKDGEMVQLQQYRGYSLCVCVLVG